MELDKIIEYIVQEVIKKINSQNLIINDKIFAT